MRATWRTILESSKQEALLAVDLYNESRKDRRLEAFFVHMHIAWLYLLHARFRRDGIDYHYRKANGRFVRVDGEPKAWELTRCVDERWDESSPVRKNLELTILIRNRIEHRHMEALAVVAGGYAQALVVNYESELTATFGKSESLADYLRFPILLGSITPEGVRKLLKLSEQVPVATRGVITEFVSGLEPAIKDDHRFEFRLHLVQKTGAKSEADLSMTFVRESDLTDEQRETLDSLSERGLVVVREQNRPVASKGLMKPGVAARKIEAQIPFRFNVYSEFINAWKILGCRPPPGDPLPDRTDERYCVYDEPHRDYLYTAAFVAKMVRETSSAKKFKAFFGRPPVPK